MAAGEFIPGGASVWAQQENACRVCLSFTLAAQLKRRGKGGGAERKKGAKPRPRPLANAGP